MTNTCTRYIPNVYLLIPNISFSTLALIFIFERYCLNAKKMAIAINMVLERIYLKKSDNGLSFLVDIYTVNKTVNTKDINEKRAISIFFGLLNS